MQVQHTTKNDIYAELIALGTKRGLVCIPEFRVEVPPHIPGLSRTKTIDLVWARRLNEGRQEGLWADHWELVATFEIEACDVRNIPFKEFARHLNDLPAVSNQRTTAKIAHFIVLYTAAYDRKWRMNRPHDNEIRIRQEWAKPSGVRVLDGRDLSAIEELRV
jgi:hypothetical protein